MKRPANSVSSCWREWKDSPRFGSSILLRNAGIRRMNFEQLNKSLSSGPVKCSHGAEKQRPEKTFEFLTSHPEIE